MWLMTQHGFYSIVEKSPEVFHVRSRARRDLENLVALLADKHDQPEILHTPHNDYPFRVIVGKYWIAGVVEFMVKSIDYSNFKDRVYSLPDQREKPYCQVWSTMRYTAKEQTQ